MSVCCKCCVFSGRDLYAELITRPEESCRLWWNVQCDLETSWMRRPFSTCGGGTVAPKTNKKQTNLQTKSLQLLVYLSNTPVMGN
jgi:hypothetical protein